MMMESAGTTVESAGTMMESGASASRNNKRTALKARVPANPEASAGANQMLFVRLLGMAQRYRSEGKLQEAMELYWELVEDHPGTAEAGAANAVLLDLAANYERDEAPHMARSIYERLLAQEN